MSDGCYEVEDVLDDFTEFEVRSKLVLIAGLIHCFVPANKIQNISCILKMYVQS